MNNDDNPNVAKQFSLFLQDFADGRLDDRLSQRFGELVAACRETGKKGGMTIKINVKPEGTMSHVTFDLKVSLPEHPLPGASYYSSEDGQLTTEDPRQLKLPGKIIHATGVPRVVQGGKRDDDDNDGSKH
jgi:hypothetical protein